MFQGPSGVWAVLVTGSASITNNHRATIVVSAKPAADTLSLATFPTTPIILSFADHPPCDLQTPIERCGVLARSGAGPKPRTLSLSDAAPGSYWLYILNDGSEADSAAAQVVLSSPTCPAFAAFAAFAAVSAEGSQPRIRVEHAVPW